jgi:release factor glutamine methyltransferase
MTLYTRITEARGALVAAGISVREAGFDADLLASRVLGCDRAQLVTRLRDEEPPDFAARFAPLISRRAAREPMAYILGEREFWAMTFEVTPDVLIPRPETELMVEEAIRLHRYRPPSTIIDVCTGSGCLAVALATEFPLASVIATDISDAALKVAHRNAARHGVQGRVRFERTDMLEGVDARAPLIVCNPPYVPAGHARALMPEVTEFEPHVALFAGDDGLDAYRRLLPMAAAHLEPGGRLMVEVGYDQDGPVADLASRQGWRPASALRDLQGITRTLVLEHTSHVPRRG